MEVKDSSQIKSANYDHLTGTLTLQFHYEGRIYIYNRVAPEVWEGFQKSKSKGEFFHKIIKPAHESRRVI